MNNKITLVLVVALSLGATSYAQVDKEERKELHDEKSAANKDKVDYSVFRRQILTLPEFGEERRKLAEIKKKTKTIPKIYAVVDSLNDSENGKTLIGFIQIGVGDNVVNTYEITFDRTKKKIATVKPTGEKLEVEREEEPATKKTTARQPVKKKKTDEDEEDSDDEDEEKPTKGKDKDEDD